MADDPQKNSILDLIILIVAAILGVGGLVCFGCFIWLIADSPGLADRGNVDMGISAQVGDFIGGVVGALWSLTGVLLFYSALRLQKREFRAQREELGLQREELKSQREEFMIGRITNVVYRQIDLIKEAITNLSFQQQNNKIIKGEAVLGFIQHDLGLSLSKLQQNVNNNPNPLSRFFTHITEKESKHLISTLTNSCNICKSLIEQQNETISTHDSVLSATQKSQLSLLFVGNLNVPNLLRYLETLEKIHFQLMEQLNFGDNHKWEKQQIETINSLQHLLKDLSQISRPIIVQQQNS